VPVEIAMIKTLESCGTICVVVVDMIVVVFVVVVVVKTFPMRIE
jgi:hypothetical protein